MYTFNAAQQGASVVITYRYLVDPSAYTVTLPNLLIFDSAPLDGSVVSATFDFWFVCRFIEDSMDFEKFSDKLWQLQKCDFKSILMVQS